MMLMRIKRLWRLGVKRRGVLDDTTLLCPSGFHNNSNTRQSSRLVDVTVNTSSTTNTNTRTKSKTGSRTETRIEAVTEKGIRIETKKVTRIEKRTETESRTERGARTTGWYMGRIWM